MRTPAIIATAMARTATDVVRQPQSRHRDRFCAPRLWSFLLLLPGCVSTGPTLAPDEIADRDVFLPKGARAGMHLRWRITGTDVVEEEWACVPGSAGSLTIERREVRADGSRTVTAARFAADGTVLGVWRGPPGGRAQRLRIVPSDAAATVAKANALGREHGVSATADQEVAEETIATAAGPIACTRQRTTASAWFVSGTFTSWHARDPLPLSQLVRFEADMIGWHELQELVAHGTTGAVPTLPIPADDPATVPR